MNDPEHAHLPVSPITIQALPDGADNLNGLITSLLRNATMEQECTNQDARTDLRTGTTLRSRIRSAWWFLRNGRHRPASKTFHLNLAQIPEK
jgi:hypothetical protein